MLIVAGTFVLAPEDRDEFIETRRAAMLSTRDEPGCIDFVFSPDGSDPRKVRLFEIWESREHLDVHLEGRRAAGGRPTTPPVLERETLVYEISSFSPLE